MGTVHPLNVPLGPVINILLEQGKKIVKMLKFFLLAQLLRTKKSTACELIPVES
jgi:hypothetical protein